MNKPIIFSLIESPAHPNFSQLFVDKGYDEKVFFSVRKIISALKKQKPDIVIVKFHYQYVSDYASNHISNVDSLLASLQKYSDYQPKFIFFTSKKDKQFIKLLTDHYEGFARSVHALVMPVQAKQMGELL